MKKSQIRPLLVDLAAAFEAEIKKLPIKPKAREDMLAGFRDGSRSILLKLQQDGHLSVEDDTSEAGGAP